MEKTIELVWSGLVIIGSLILADDRELSRKKRVGILLIVTGFVIQALWVSYDMGWSTVIGVLVIATVGTLWPYRKQILKVRPLKRTRTT
ncbi:MAG: hypothetical protein HY683_02355 [Chloroflexi bacterium]|nr:hypothetical protein [Chloroflexota bacterium]